MAVPLKARARIIPSIDKDGMIHVCIEWVHLKDDTVDPEVVLFKEEFRISPSRSASYVSRVEISECKELPGTFWTDERGLRHFIANIEPAQMGLIAQPLGE